MSQGGPNNVKGSGADPLETLTGNSGGAVTPDVLFNIDILGNNATGIDIVGSPGSNLLTVIGISSSTIQIGTVELATAVETGTLTDTTRAITPDSLEPILVTPYVVAPGGAYTTIQSALDAANAAGGGTVYVRPAIYTENLTLYDAVDLWGAVGVADTETCKIIGVHTPASTGAFTIRNIFLQSATDIFNSAVAGSSLIILIDVAVDVTNGFTFNLLNWTGVFVGFNIGEIQSVSDGWVNNTGGATVFMTNITMGAGTAQTMVTSGVVELYNCVVNCPVSFSTGTVANVIDGGTVFLQPVTLAGNSTGLFKGITFTAGASAAITMSSSADWSVVNSNIDSSNNPSISGAGAGTLNIENVTFIDNAEIAATITLGTAGVVKASQFETLPLAAGSNLSGSTWAADGSDSNIDLFITPKGTGGAVIPTNLTLGETAQDVTYTINGATIDSVVAVHTEGATDLGGFTEERHTDTAGFGPHHIYLRTRGNEAASTAVQDGDALSREISCGYDGTDYAQSAEIRVEVDGTPGNNDMPGRMKFLTSPDGTQVPVLAMTVDSSQVVTLTNSLDVFHTSTSAEDHAIEIECDAAGFGDVKALDIVYITGAIAAGDDEEVMLVNIDESASTGGNVAGYQVLSTSEGLATISGYTTGININPILHNSGTFGNADDILNKAVDVTAALASGGAGNITVFVLNSETMTFGDAGQFNEMEIILDTEAGGGGIAPTFEFSTGGVGFTSFTPSDGTNGLRNNGAILWIAADLAGWVANATGFFEVKMTRNRVNLPVIPIMDEVQISSATEFIWDKAGDLTVNSITLTTDLTVANGGTGASTLTGVLTGNGTSAFTASAVTDNTVVMGSTSNLLQDTTITVTDAGEMVNASQPSFSAYLGTTDLNETGDGTVYTFGDTDVGTALTELFDIGSNFTPGASGGAIFTAPVAGIYCFSGAVSLLDLGAGHTAMDAFFSASTAGAFYIGGGDMSNMKDVNSQYNVNGSVILTLAALETVKFALVVYSSTKTVDIGGAVDFKTYFSGYLLG